VTGSGDERRAADHLPGLSTQDLATQRDVASRLALPYTLLADPEVALGGALGLPTFVAGGLVRYRRLTLVVADGRIEHVFYPIFPPQGHASEVLAWLSAGSFAR
jgi:peroxiredoxin